MKRTLSIILTLVLLLGALPLTVFAADVDTAEVGADINVNVTVNDWHGQKYASVTWDAVPEADFYIVSLYNDNSRGLWDIVSEQNISAEDTCWCVFGYAIMSRYAKGGLNYKVKIKALRKPQGNETYNTLIVSGESEIFQTGLEFLTKPERVNLDSNGTVTWTPSNETYWYYVTLKNENGDKIIGKTVDDPRNDCIYDFAPYVEQAGNYYVVVQPTTGNDVNQYDYRYRNLADDDGTRSDIVFVNRGVTGIQGLTWDGYTLKWDAYPTADRYQCEVYKYNESTLSFDRTVQFWIETNQYDFEFFFNQDGTGIYRVKVNASRLQNGNYVKISDDTYSPVAYYTKKYPISYLGNGGWGNVDTIEVDEFTKYTLPDNIYFTPPEGKEFDKWQNYSTGDYYKPGDVLTITSRVTFIPIWKESKYVTVTFDKNGGTGTMGTYQAHRGYSYTLPNCSFTPPSGKMFDCWLVDGQRIKAYGSFVATKNVTAVAQWVNKPVITTISKMDVYLDKLPADGNLPSLSASAPIGSGYHVATDYNRNYYQNGVWWQRKTAAGNWTNVNPETERFVEGTEYKVNIMMFPDDGYEFNTSGMTATLNGEAATVPNETGSWIYTTSADVTQKFTCGATDLIPITEMNFTVTAPVAGQNPDYNVIFPTTSPFKIDSSKGVSWRVIGSADTYVEGETYSIMFYVIPDDGFYFDPDKDVMITINGEAKKIDVWSNNKFRVQVTRQYVCEAASVTGFTVSGSYTSYLDSNQAAKIELLQNDTVKYATASSGNSGSYSIPGVAAGSYTLRVSKKNHVTRDYVITVSGNTTQDVKIHPIGDISGDGIITILDFGRANSHVKGVVLLTGYELACADTLPPYGTVTIMDAGRINSHVKKISKLW